jgi:hypothetical protein
MKGHLLAHIIPIDSTDMIPKEPCAMPPTYVLARDHLQRAVAMLQGADSRSRQLRYIIERTINLLDEAPEPGSNVLSFSAFREGRAGSLD